ncbi:hypothetical protein GIB67_010320 [Kingdonia uniflora]|uniref:Uncharacterized protein n=1 Tax=Kingdonia uniflora TaxID=39325 RepID=A0A7J7LD76_9MAGN|nr:hypothetical protein GIB67_010320 [Kingdonia uniflora]
MDVRLGWYDSISEDLSFRGGRLAIKIIEVCEMIFCSFGYDVKLLGRECKLKGRTWNDNIIWVKGNCLQRDDEEPLDLRFRTVKQSVKSKVERKESLLDEVAEKETKLEHVLEGFGLSRKKRVDSRSNKPNPVKLSKIALKYPKKRMLKALPASGTIGSGKVAKDKRRRVEPSGESGEKVVEGRSAMVNDLKEVKERARLVVLQGEEDTSKMVVHLAKGIWLGIKEDKSELKKANVELEKELAQSRTDGLKKVRQLKASHALVIGQLQVETKANLDKMVEECDRLGHNLMLKGYSEEEVDTIKADTNVEEEDEKEAETVGIVDGLDGVSRQTVLDNQEDDVELPEGGSEKVELDSSRSREGDVLMCNWEFVEQFDRIKEANKNREDQYVKAHFRLVELTHAVSDLTLQVEEKDVKIKKGLKELAETELVQDIARAKKAEASERLGGSRTEVKSPLVGGDVVSLSSQIIELESNVSRIQGHVQKGNVNLREYQHKLHAALIREKVLEGEIKTKESLVKRKE